MSLPMPAVRVSLPAPPLMVSLPFVPPPLRLAVHRSLAKSIRHSNMQGIYRWLNPRPRCAAIPAVERVRRNKSRCGEPCVAAAATRAARPWQRGSEITTAFIR